MSRQNNVYWLAGWRFFGDGHRAHPEQKSIYLAGSLTLDDYEDLKRMWDEYEIDEGLPIYRVSGGRVQFARQWTLELDEYA